RGAHVVRVIVDQSGDDGATTEVEHARERPLVLLDLGIAADRENALALDRKRLGDGEPIVDGDDLAVEQHDVRRRLRRDGLAPARAESKEHDRGNNLTDDSLPKWAPCRWIMPPPPRLGFAPEAAPRERLVVGYDANCLAGRYPQHEDKAELGDVLRVIEQKTELRGIDKVGSGDCACERGDDRDRAAEKHRNEYCR